MFVVTGLGKWTPRLVILITVLHVTIQRPRLYILHIILYTAQLCDALKQLFVSEVLKKHYRHLDKISPCAICSSRRFPESLKESVSLDARVMVVRCTYSAEELMPDFDRIRVLLHSDGRLHWEPGGIFKTTCDIDIGHFPFDTQHCPMLIGAYSYYRSAVVMSACRTALSVYDMKQQGHN